MVILISGKVYFRVNNRDKENQFTNQGDIKILNVHASSHRTSKHIKKLELEGKTDKSTILVENFNTHL